MMNVFLMSLILATHTVWAAPDCENIEKDPASYVKSRAQAEDISRLLASDLGKCKIKASDYFSDSEIIELRKQGYKSQYEVYRNRMESYGQYGTINKDDYEMGLRWAKLAGIDSKELDNLSKKLSTEGNKNCGDVNLSSKMGPIRDQDTMGWCYAFAAADLLSFKLGQRISAASLAIQSNADSMPSWIKIPFYYLKD